MRPDDPYLSPQGFAKIKAEWEDLKIEREEMKKQVQIAAAEGDRSENAAYTYGKMRLRNIDRRLRQLDRIIDRSIVVQKVSEDGSIRFGSEIEIKNSLTGKIQKYTLVGSAEADALQGKISTSSPLGKVLVGRFAGERVQLPTPRGLAELEILSVREALGDLDA